MSHEARKDQMPDTTQPTPPNEAPASLALGSCSVSVGVGQRAAAQVWNSFKGEELRYVDILEMCAVLMVNVADKSQSTDHEISHMTRQMMHNMRRNASSQNNRNETRHE